MAHLDEKCPGRTYFERKEKTQKDDMREVFQEVVGDVPKYMRLAGENRIWLWVLTASLVIVGMVWIII